MTKHVTFKWDYYIDDEMQEDGRFDFELLELFQCPICGDTYETDEEGCCPGGEGDKVVATLVPVQMVNCIICEAERYSYNAKVFAEDFPSHLINDHQLW